MADTQGSDSSAADSQARQGALSSNELSELGARSGARRKHSSGSPTTKHRDRS
jgi:hypothetical protein